jgi:hypothetical protein
MQVSTVIHFTSEQGASQDSKQEHKEEHDKYEVYNFRDGVD